MAEVLDARLAPEVVDDLAIRRQLREQVARLEGELGALFCSTYPRTGFDWNVRSRGGPRLLSLGELEQVRDELAAKLQHTAACSATAPTSRSFTAAASRRCCS